MNHTITNPKGIDKEIQFSQTDLFKGLNWGNIDVYGRIRKNPKVSNAGNVSYQPEAYIGGSEYRDLYINDEVNATICFIEDEDHDTDQFGVFFTVNVKCVVMLNLKTCYPNIAHRADSEAQIDVIKQLQKNKMFTINGIEKGLQNIFQGFDIDKITTDDMHPYHVFAIIGNLKYKIIDC